MKENKSVVLALLWIPIWVLPSYLKTPSPSSFIKKVRYLGNYEIEYELNPDFPYANISVIFFGKRGVVVRNNTVLSLQGLRGKFKVSSEALIHPKQTYFNFLIKDNQNSDVWGLITRSVIEGGGITIENPSGEGDAFFITD
jgi:hypothetical protein